MAPGLALILATLVAVSGDFHNGVKELEKGNADKAAASLTKVIDAKSKIAELHELALLTRGKAYIAVEKKDLALADLKAVIQATKNPARRTEATALYRKTGGAMAKLLPKNSPTESLNALTQALENEDYKTARKYIGGDIGIMLNTADKVYMVEEGGSLLEEMADEVDEMVVISTTLDTNSITATAVIAWDAMWTVGMTAKDDHWQLSDLKEFAKERRNRHRHSGSTTSTARTLSMIGKGLRMYAMDNSESFPPKLDALKDYIGGMSMTTPNPKTGKAQPFLYRADMKLSGNSDYMHVATPLPINGNRTVLYMDGSVRTISEKEFNAKAIKQGWKLPGLMKKTDVAKDTAKEVQVLIDQLGSNSSKTRADAKRKLKAIGSDAFPFLREHVTHKDPEIRGTVKELLSQ